MPGHLLFQTYQLGSVVLKNRVVMSPMTRSRAVNTIPTDVTEGTAPSPNGLGYARIPGIYNEAQVEGWMKVTRAVHRQGGKIFVQLMHTGRISHPLNMPEGAVVLAPSAVRPAGQMWTDQQGLQDFPVPKAMTLQEVAEARKEFVSAANNAMEAGFDGVELHGANGYLLEQFLSPVSNLRTDTYGGSVEHRSRFILEVAEAVGLAIGKERTGIRLSPYGVASDMPPYPEIDATYRYLADQLNRLGILYIHIVDHSAMGSPEVPARIKQVIRERFKKTLILSGGYTQERAENDLHSGKADLITFGRPFINNPDLVQRFEHDWPLSTNLDASAFYTPGEKGYTDYPVHAG
jgi:N-ethylmaleimide reductase